MSTQLPEGRVQFNYLMGKGIKHPAIHLRLFIADPERGPNGSRVLDYLYGEPETVYLFAKDFIFKDKPRGDVEHLYKHDLRDNAKVTEWILSEEDSWTRPADFVFLSRAWESLKLGLTEYQRAKGAGESQHSWLKFDNIYMLTHQLETFEWFNKDNPHLIKVLDTEIDRLKNSAETCSPERAFALSGERAWLDDPQSKAER